MPRLQQPTLDAEFDEHFDSWLYACHACRHEGFTWVHGMYQSWTQDEVYVEMLWHRLEQHYRPDAHRFDAAFTIGFNHTVMPEPRLPS